MIRSFRKVLVLSFAVLLLGVGDARAQEDETLATRFAKRRKIRKRGAIKKLRRHKVRVAGRRDMTVGELADGVFHEHRALDREVGGPDSGLLEPPEIEDEVIETETATLLKTRTKFTVTDPKKLRGRSKRFQRMRSRKARGGWKLSQLGPAGRKEFEAFKKRLKKRKPGHPLRKAMEKGDDALVDAILEGKGDVTVETTVVVPKNAMARDRGGRLLVPKAAADGAFDYRTTTPVRTTVSSTPTLSSAPVSVIEVGRTPRTMDRTSARGKTSHTAKFLTGFTKEDNFVWQQKWKFPSGHLIVKFKPWYEFGLRVPLEIKGTIDPATITYTGTRDKAVEYEVAFKAKALDAPRSFYEEVGLEKSKVNGGKEFVLGAGFEVVIDLKAGFVVKKKWVIPKNASFDFSQDFRPPFGDCGTNCGFDLWIPAEVTRTKLSLLGIVTGSARVGFKLTGDADVRADVQAISIGKEIKSWRPGQKNSPKNKHTLEFSKSSDEERIKAEASASRTPDKTLHYGYKISEPRYDWNVDMIPGVRADIRVKAKPFVNDNFPIGPLWLNSLKIDLGTVKLKGHAGTKRSYSVPHGDKTWKQR